MEKSEVIRRLVECENEMEWEQVCDEVKEGCEHPSWWFAEVVESGLANRAQKSWAVDVEAFAEGASSHVVR